MACSVGLDSFHYLNATNYSTNINVIPNNGLRRRGKDTYTMGIDIHSCKKWVSPLESKPNGIVFYLMQQSSKDKHCIMRQGIEKETNQI